MGALLTIKDLSKSYGSVRALQNVQFSLQAGEVHALMGENGAGKSTLMKILAGLITPDTGSITLDGHSFAPTSIQEVQQAGIAMIHQELLLVPELSIAENIFLGREKKKFLGLWTDQKAQAQEAELLLKEVGLDKPANTLVKSLSVAEMQLVEIAKAISNRARIIIMDEPTSALSDKEVTSLFVIIRRLQQQGVGIVYISHKMDEIFQIANRITILRDGTYIGTHQATDLSESDLIHMMVGRTLTQLFPEPSNHNTSSEIVLEVQSLTRKPYFEDISFQLKKGEILGLAGLMGAGRTEVARVLFGLDPADSGTIFLHSNPIRLTAPTDALRYGIGYVSEDRKAVGLVTMLSVADNMTMASLQQHANKGWLNPTSEAQKVAEMVDLLRIKIASPQQRVSELSGGNQQKIAIAKILLANPKVIILDEPTRGIDIGAKAEIYKLIRELAEQGLSIILISSEMPEIIGLCDRVVVMSQGRQTALLPRVKLTQEEIMAHAVHH